jgi:competence protein ComEC
VLHKEIPFLRIGLPLCCGIITGLYCKPDTAFLVAATVLIISGFVFSLRFNKSINNIVFGYTISFSLFVCGLILYTNEKSSLSVLKPEKSVFVCTLSDYPEEKENTFILRLKMNSRIDGKEFIAVKGSILVYNKKDISPGKFIPGDQLVVRCNPVEIENRGNPFEFDYRFFMENRGFRYYAFTSSQDLISHISPQHRKLIHKALITRERIIQMFRERGIEGERLALVAAITLGQKSMLDPEQKMNFIKAGVMHIMAVSGLHAIIISLFVLTVLFFMKRKLNIVRVVTAIVILWAFAFVTGLTPSVLRATLMFTFLQAGKLMKRPSNGINSVLASAFFLILIQPSVIFNAGFLLSYAAVIYIIMFYQDFYLVFHFKNWLADKVWQSTAITIIAQAGTLPLTLLLFNRFPVYFILANITIVPVTNLLIITGCFVPLFFKIRFLSHWAAVLLNFLTGLTQTMTEKTASLPWSTIENIGLSTPECIFLTCAIFLFLTFILKGKSFKSSWLLLFPGLFVLTGSMRAIYTKRTNELIVYNTPGLSNIGIRTGKILNLYSDTSIAAPDVRRHCAIMGLKIKPVLIKNDYYFIKAGSEKILITDFLKKEMLQKLKPDIIVLTDIKTLNKNYSPGPERKIIIVSSASGKAFKLPSKENKNKIDSVYYIRNSGAFVKRI